MYESPIRLMETRMQTEIEKEIFRAIKEVEVCVDKVELVKALQYDRDQYQKGYEDGIKEFAERLKEQYPFDGYYHECIDDCVKEMTERGCENG